MKWKSADVFVKKNPDGTEETFVEICNCLEADCRSENISIWFSERHLLIWCRDCEHKHALDYEILKKIGAHKECGNK